MIRSSLFLLVLFSGAISAGTIDVSTWNIEHLGSSGRGFGGGYGAGNIPGRSVNQLQDIADLINAIGSDVLALQEVAVNYEVSGVSRSKQLDQISKALGPSWKYYLPPVRGDMNSVRMQCAYLWDSQKVEVIKVFPLGMPEYFLRKQPLFDRQPIVAYVKAKGNSGNNNDFLLINVHLKSGQENDENHLVAMIMLEQELKGVLESYSVRESDRIILGDFNDDPYLVRNGRPVHLPTLYDYLEHKGYQDLVAPSRAGVPYTRMSSSLDSIIDHIMVNQSASRHISSAATAYYPPGGISGYPLWRETYSDHFPITFSLQVSADDDVD